MPQRRWLIVLVLLAISARAAAVLLLQSHRVPRSTYEHGEIAANLIAGRGFSTQFLGAEGATSQQAPLYPVIVAATYWLGGVETPRALLLLELAQSLLGGVLVVAVVAIADQVAPGQRAVAFLAGLFAALHPTLVYAATHVQVALLATVLLALVVAESYRAAQTGRIASAALCGVWLALLMLTDPILALALPGAIWALVQGQGVRRGVQLASVVLVVAGLGVAPWIARNAAVHGELVFIKSTFGYAFWQGNCNLSQGTDKVARASVERVFRQQERAGLKGLNETLWRARHEAGYLDDIALTKADRLELGRLTEPERSRRLFRRALAELSEQPGRYAELCFRRLRYFIFFDESNPKTRNVVYRASHLGLTCAAAFGIWMMGATARRRLAPTFLTAGLIAAFHTLTIVSARFHIPIEPLLGLWAAAGLAQFPRLAASGDVVGVGVDDRFSRRPGRVRVSVGG